MLSREKLVAFLRQALAAERAGGFRDRSVAGGLARLAVTIADWEARTGETARFPADLLRKLAVYGKVAPPSRPAAVESLERLVGGALALEARAQGAPFEARQTRVGTS